MKNRTTKTRQRKQMKFILKNESFVTLTQHEALVLITKVQYDKSFFRICFNFCIYRKGALVTLRMPSS